MKRIVLILLAFSMISLSAFAKVRVALVIGNSNYQVKPLSNPVNDARDMAKMLRELGFDVTLKVNADQMTMESAIEAFGKKLHENAVGLFYFSGHGAQYAGENYLIPINSIQRTAAAGHLKYKAVPAGYVLDVMPENGLNIVILDACRDNPFKGFSKSLGQGLTRTKSVQGSLIAYATAPGTVAWTGKAGERNSPYTKHLLRFMKQPNLSIESLLKKVRKAVIWETRYTRTVQKPWYEASISDDFYFVENFQPGVQPPPVVDNTASTAGKFFRDRLQDGSLGPEMVRIPAGQFRMGDIQGGGHNDEKPVHQVWVSEFAIGQYEVTFAEYDKFAQATKREKPDDEGWGRGNRPVINVFWHDAIAYAEWLSQQTGQTYRLPTEAEWEYAARAGTETKYWWGNEIGSNKANCWNCGDHFEYTSPVGSFAANPFGLYDTVGNVWEWTCSEFESKYSGKEKNCISKNHARLLVIRGGSWNIEAGIVRTANRYGNSRDFRGNDVGFRLARITL